MIPKHMQRSVDEWIQHGTPHPHEMGSFFRAVLLHDLMAAAMFADDENRKALYEWAAFMRNEMPSAAHGTEAKLIDWHLAGGDEGIESKGAAE